MDALTQSVDELADEETITRSLAVAGGYLGSSIAQSTLEGLTPFDVPNEAYGLGVAAVAGAYSPMYAEEMMMGGVVYTADAAAQRFGFKQTVTDLGGGN